jgi:hypothetical protein
LILQQITGDGRAAACLSHVTGQTEVGLAYFECATFATVKDGLKTQRVEVRADVDKEVPDEARPV